MVVCRYVHQKYIDTLQIIIQIVYSNENIGSRFHFKTTCTEQPSMFFIRNTVYFSHSISHFNYSKFGFQTSHATLKFVMHKKYIGGYAVCIIPSLLKILLTKCCPILAKQLYTLFSNYGKDGAWWRAEWSKLRRKKVKQLSRENGTSHNDQNFKIMVNKWLLYNEEPIASVHSQPIVKGSSNNRIS